MTKRQHRTVGQLAQQVRLRAEKYAAENDMPDNLCGMCAIASGWLHTALREAGLRATIHMNTSRPVHCYVTVRGYVVDVTASQFGNDAVCIVPAREARKRFDYWRVAERRPRSAYELRMAQQDAGWEQDQVAL